MLRLQGQGRRTFTTKSDPSAQRFYHSGGPHTNTEARAAAYYCRGQLHDLAGERDQAHRRLQSSYRMESA